jgi:hypothetical protein
MIVPSGCARWAARPRSGQLMMLPIRARLSKRVIVRKFSCGFEKPLHNFVFSSIRKGTCHSRICLICGAVFARRSGQLLDLQDSFPSLRRGFDSLHPLHNRIKDLHLFFVLLGDSSNRPCSPRALRSSTALLCPRTIFPLQRTTIGLNPCPKVKIFLAIIRSSCGVKRRPRNALHARREISTLEQTQAQE